MCWCNPSIRTPNCGRPGCVPPTSATLPAGPIAKQVGWWVQFPPDDEVEKEIGFFLENEQRQEFFSRESMRPHNVLPAFVMEPTAEQQPLDARPPPTPHLDAWQAQNNLERRVEALERAVGQRVRMHGDFPVVANGVLLGPPWEILADPGMSYEFRRPPVDEAHFAEIMRLAMHLAHVYRFVGDEMPRAKAALEVAVRKAMS